MKKLAKLIFFDCCDLYSQQPNDAVMAMHELTKRTTFSHLADAFVQSDVQGREVKLRAIKSMV